MVEIIDSISKYNLWGGNSPFLGFNRHIYQEKVLKSVGNSLVKVVVGQRRVGKSFVLRQILSKIVAGGVPAENTLRGWTAGALYHNPAHLCQKTTIRPSNKGKFTGNRTWRGHNTSSPKPQDAKHVTSPAEQVRLPALWCV